MSSFLLTALTSAYRRGWIRRGAGVVFDRIPTWMVGGSRVSVSTGTGRMTLPLRDHGPRQILVYGHPRNEIRETELLRRLAPRLTCALDIGANVGWYTRVLGAGGARVVAFEPNTQIFPFAQMNARDLPDAVVNKRAVAEQAGHATFYEAPSSDLSSSTRAVGAPVETEVVTIDDLTADGTLVPEFVKCDVEGGEMQVLRGARRFRASEQAPAWLIEADETFLREQGWDYDDLETEVRSTGEIHLFAADQTGTWSELAHFSDLRGTGVVNVLMVPDQRLELVAGLVGTA